jgi:hypothetical protein
LSGLLTSLFGRRSLAAITAAALACSGMGRDTQAACLDTGSCDQTVGDCEGAFQIALETGFGVGGTNPVNILLQCGGGVCAGTAIATFRRPAETDEYKCINISSVSTMTCLLDPWSQLNAAIGTAMITTGATGGTTVTDEVSLATDCTGAISANVSPALPPDTEILTGPADLSTTTDTSVSFTYTSWPPGATFETKLDGGAWVATAATSFAQSGLAVGDHMFQVRAVDGPLVDATPSVRSWAILPASTTTVLTSGTNPSVTGESVILTANVSTGVGTPEGTVTFKDGGTTIGSGSLTAGSATVTVPFTAGTHSLTAVFASTDGNHTGSTSASVTQFVTNNVFHASFETCGPIAWADDMLPAFFSPSPCTPEFGDMEFSANGFVPTSSANEISVVAGMTDQALRIFKGGPHVAGNSPEVKCNFIQPITSGDLTVSYRVQRKSVNESSFFAAILGPGNFSVTTVNWGHPSATSIIYRVGDGLTNNPSGPSSMVEATGVVNGIGAIITVTVVVHVTTKTFDITITDGTNTHSSTANKFHFNSLSEINAAFFENGGSSNAEEVEHWIDDVQVTRP